MQMVVKDVFHHGKKTEAANTVIDLLVPWKPALKPVVSTVAYTNLGTAHVLTALVPLGRTTLSAGAAASQAVINLVADPGVGTAAGVIAANDYVVLENDDGSCALHKVSSVASLAITLTANLATAISAGKRVWFLGVIGDHATRQWALAASATTTLADALAGIVAAGREEPLVLNSGNATNAGIIDKVSVAYVDSGRK